MVQEAPARVVQHDPHPSDLIPEEMLSFSYPPPKKAMTGWDQLSQAAALVSAAHQLGKG